MTSEQPLLELRDAARTFGRADAAVHALAGVSLKIGAGTSLAVTGRSGSGKSTLLNVIGLVEVLTAGQYFVGGQDTSSLAPRDLNALRAGMFGFVFQAFHLVPYLTVAENVEMGMTYRRRPGRERARRVATLLEQVGLGHRRDASVATLSGGERQRTAVARALVRQPVVLLADEPTGNLDDASAAGVIELLDAIVSEGIALVMVTHDRATAARAQRQVHIRDGRIQPNERVEA